MGLLGTSNGRGQASAFLLIAFALMLLIPVSCTLAQDKDSAYQKRAGPTPLQRTLDAYGKGPFCAGCHNLLYPLPPENQSPQPAVVVEPTVMEPGLKRLTSSPGRDVGAVYSPEGGRIVWVTDSLGNWTIWVMNDDGTGKQQLTPSNVISGWPSWSPDGGEIAYWSWDPASKTCDIWKVRSDGSSRVKLTVDGSFKGPPMWSPRGDRIAYTANQTGNMEVYVMKTDGAGIRQLTRGHNPEYWVESRTTWHPDGVHLYYQVTTFPLPPLTVPEIKDDVAFVEIFMLNVDTGEERNLTPRLHENVRSISKDDKMACISLRSPNYGLWIMNEDGTGQTRLTWNGKGDRAPRITPDGKKIVYWSLASGNPDIWVINSDGTNNTQLTRSPYMDIYPQWSPDGKKIIFESDRAGNFDIWQLSLNDPVSVSVDFGKCVVLGSMGKASLTIRQKNILDTLVVEKVWLHFDWESEGRYAESLSSPPNTSKTDGLTHITLEFPVPKNLELGYHFYDVKIQYTLNDRTELRSKTYEHTAKDLEVGTIQEYDCQTFYVQLGSELNHLYGDAINRSISLGVTTSEVTVPLKGYFNYLLTENGEKFQEANEEYHKARELYLAEDYDAALPHFLKAKAILGELLSGSVAESKPSNLVSITTLSAAAVLTILLIMLSKKRLAAK
jgi:Tol biopolymer transport system component